MKLLIYIEAAVHFERLRKVLSPHFNFDFIHLDEERSTKLRLVSHSKECSLALVDCDSNPEGAITFTRLLRQLANCPIIALSSTSDVAYLKRIMEVGCTDFMLKPYEDLNLITRLQKCLKNQLISDPDGYLIGRKALEQNAAVSSTEDSTASSEAAYLFQSVPLTWQAAFELGVPDIDLDHKRILEHYHELYLNMREGKGQEDYERHVEFLMKYVEEHFDREERLQAASGYSEIERHKAMHQNFKLMVAQMIKEYQLRGVTNRDLVRLNLFIKDWLLRHILIEDRKLAKHLKK